MTNRHSSFAAFVQRWHLSHPLLALAKMSPFAVVGLWWWPASWIGAMFAVGFYYGREVAHVGAAIPNNRWYAGYLPTNWSHDNHLDFWPVLAVCAALAAGVTAL
jgi:hypothetical protein